MITRIVRMTISPDKVDQFRKYFYNSCQRIRGSSGCTHLELFCDASAENVMITYSKWEDENALNAYRDSLLFKET
jgi:(4S)-4-hydroxy-5-phosphonooxypentane-2,3-dione isomerase